MRMHILILFVQSRLCIMTSQGTDQKGSLFIDRWFLWKCELYRTNLVGGFFGVVVVGKCLLWTGCHQGRFNCTKFKLSKCKQKTEGPVCERWLATFQLHSEAAPARGVNPWQQIPDGFWRQGSQPVCDGSKARCQDSHGGQGQ